MITNDYPFELKRVKFLIKLCFEISINEAQGQTMQVAELDKTDPCALLIGNFMLLALVLVQKKSYLYTHLNKKIILFVERF